MLWSKKKKAEAPGFIVLGLGNPGMQYADTRHNVGWWVLDDVSRLGRDCQTAHRHQGHVEYCRVGSVQSALVKPTTFYNRAGQCLKAWKSEFPEAGLLVVHDDFTLELGKIRLRRGGRSGGNNGVQSIIDILGTDDFARLKIGLGSPPAGLDAADYVLEQPSKAELKALHDAVATAAQMVMKVVQGDWQGALDELTRRGMQDKE